MKKSKVLASFLALTLVTQGIPANVLAEEVAKDMEKISVTSMNSNIKRNNNSIIKDTSLEAGIRERLKLKPDQELTKERLEGITELNLPNKGIESLEGLENCKGLKKLNLRGNKIIDIEPIKELCEKQGMFSVMTYLDLRENKIQDISPIKDMSRYLNTLYLENQNIEVNESVNKADMNGSYETECTLKGLDGSLITPYAIKANGILNGSYSQGKINWTNLNDDSNKLEYEYSQNDISFGFGGKANFTGKVTINLTVKEETVNIPDKNLENKLIELLSYKGVKVTSGNITKSMLEKFDGSLDLIGLNITNPEGLQYTKVKYLDLANNKLSDEDLSVIKEIKTLESLDLHDNNISNISDLSGLTKLTKLELANNKIENISALEGLVNIEELDLSNDWEKTTNKNVNKISDISVLSKLTKLKYIKLDGNAISDITPIKDRILNETIKSRYHEKQIIEVNKEVKASDKTFDISNDIKGFDDDITIEVTNGTYKDGKITVTDLEKPVSYTFKDEHAVGAEYTARFSGTVNVKLTVKDASKPEPKPTPVTPSNPSVPSSPSISSNKNVAKEEIVGSNRFETALKISEKWSKADNVILTNSDSTVDAMTAGPLAYAKDAPILLSKTNSLSGAVKNRISELGAKKVYLIGGEAVLSKNIVNELKAMGVEVVRISGSNRFETSLNIAKELDKIKDISKVAVVNGQSGLADSVSISAPAAMNNMPIILSDNNGNMPSGIDFIIEKKISESYIVGGKSVVSNKVENELKTVTKSSVKRLAGKNRLETNTNVINEFYSNELLSNVFIVKDGNKSASDLVDALAVGPYAAKVNAPVMLVGKGLDQSQEKLIKGKKVEKVTRIGGNGNENAFEEILNTVK